MFLSLVCVVVLFEMASGQVVQNNYAKVLGKSIAVVNESVIARSKMNCVTQCTNGNYSLAEYNTYSKVCHLGNGGLSNIVTSSVGGAMVFLVMGVCGSPDVPVFGSVEVSVDNSVSTYSCNPGYALNGPASQQCVEGSWDGALPTCQEIDECLSSPCMYGGTCSDQINGYICACAVGYTGMDCEQEIDECLSTPCLNGATCVDQLNGYICACAAGFTGILCETDIDECASSPCPVEATCVDLVNKYWCNTGITDCYDLKLSAPNSPSGIYPVTLWQSLTMMDVFCDMTTDTGGWTVIQSRNTGLLDFYRTFIEYENGFGDLNLEFWTGLKNIQEMVAQGPTELRFDLTAADDSTADVTFQNFDLLGGNMYVLQNDPGVGTAGDTSGLSYSVGKNFSTHDLDRDPQSTRNCAVDDHGGWWYNNCAHANLNGEYVTPGTIRPVRGEGGMIYRSFKSEESLKATKIMIRRVL